MAARKSGGAAAFELRAEERAPLSLLVSKQLRQQIVSGKVTIGTELPSEKDLVRDLGVGRSTVREALRILQAQGLVSGGDTVSTRRPRVSTEEVLRGAAAVAVENVVRLGQIPLRDLVELRVVLEGAALDLASKADDAALADAREAVEVMSAKDIDIDAFRAADLRFHRALASASGNVAFPLVMGILRGAVASHLGEALHQTASPKRAMARLAREHGAILNAVAAGCAKKARELMTTHIRAFYEERGKR